MLIKSEAGRVGRLTRNSIKLSSDFFIALNQVPLEVGFEGRDLDAARPRVEFVLSFGFFQVEAKQHRLLVAFLLRGRFMPLSHLGLQAQTPKDFNSA